jgi:hypothetical protein
MNDNFVNDVPSTRRSPTISSRQSYKCSWRIKKPKCFIRVNEAYTLKGNKNGVNPWNLYHIDLLNPSMHLMHSAPAHQKMYFSTNKSNLLLVINKIRIIIIVIFVFDTMTFFKTPFNKLFIRVFSSYFK